MKYAYMFVFLACAIVVDTYGMQQPPRTVVLIPGLGPIRPVLATLNEYGRVSDADHMQCLSKGVKEAAGVLSGYATSTVACGDTCGWPRTIALAIWWAWRVLYPTCVINHHEHKRK